ncbi:MAG TPA: SprT family zinc-dependent metalloprotease [Solirubrobacteraceae bacterium]|nr:SprT family zinc-dependent metalloprotease [Solirubrobacteraceae bacterium]
MRDGTDAESIDYTIRRSPRARRVQVRVTAEGVEAVLPARAAEREAAAAVAELEPWIARRLAELRAAAEAVARRGDRVPYLGQMLRLRAEHGRLSVRRSGDELLVPAGGDQEGALERWYRRAARREIEPRLERACATVGGRYASLSIRGQRTRWASCSAAGAMSFNWRLLLAPEDVLDYVIWHEVCHLEVMDHSPRFWALVSARCPSWREHAAWLRRHGSELVLPRWPAPTGGEGQPVVSSRRSAA